MGGHTLYEREQEKLARMERNLALQYDAIRKTVERSGGTLNLTPELIKELHRLAMQDLYSCAGHFREVQREPRRSSVRIRGSKHKPPEDDHVAGLVDDLCDTVNLIVAVNPIRAAAILMWKLCWIHPFHGGNGRTARGAAYPALCVGFKQFLPGRPTVVEQLDASRRRYIESLEDADSAWRESQVVDVTQIERLLEEMLKIQLGRPPLSMVVRQEVDLSLLEQGRVIQSAGNHPRFAVPPRPVVARQEVDPSTLEPGRIIQSAVNPPLPPADK